MTVFLGVCLAVLGVLVEIFGIYESPGTGLNERLFQRHIPSIVLYAYSIRSVL